MSLSPDCKTSSPILEIFSEPLFKDIIAASNFDLKFAFFTFLPTRDDCGVIIASSKCKFFISVSSININPSNFFKTSRCFISPLKSNLSFSSIISSGETGDIIFPFLFISIKNKYSRFLRPFSFTVFDTKLLVCDTFNSIRCFSISSFIFSYSGNKFLQIYKVNTPNKEIKKPT